jgi:hypothetical protein
MMAHSRALNVHAQSEIALSKPVEVVNGNGKRLGPLGDFPDHKDQLLAPVERWIVVAAAFDNTSLLRWDSTHLNSKLP